MENILTWKYVSYTKIFKGKNSKCVENKLFRTQFNFCPMITKMPEKANEYMSYYFLAA